MSEAVDRVAALSAKKRELLARRLRAEAKPAGPPAIPRRAAAGPARLSFAQERLWFLDRWQPGSPAYNLIDVIELAGRLEVAALAAALSAVIDRHESLRMVFREVAGVPFQEARDPAAGPAARAELGCVDLTALADRDRDETARRLALAEGRRAFDLARGPLLRTRLLRLAAARHHLVLTVHHIVSDLWSFGVFVRELGGLYLGLAAGEPAALPEPEIQYADFAVWQRERLTGEVLDAELGYWRERLTGAPFVLDLPADRPRPAIPSGAGAVVRFLLPPPLVGRLRTLAQESGGTLFMVLLAAFDLLLHRQSGQREVLVGTPVAGRGRRELDPLIGLFVNTLVLRADLGGDLTFRDLLAQVRETTLAALAHQELPFERLLETLHPERDLTRPPLVQAFLALQNVAIEPLRLPGLTLAPVDLDLGTAKFDLSLFLTEAASGIEAAFEYNTDLFDGTRIARLGRQLRRLLEAAAAAPASPLSRLPWMDGIERQQVLHEWNDAAAAYPPGALLHQLFMAQAARSPDAVAVRFETASLSYRELDRRTSQLARALAARGVGAETVVGVLLERSLEMNVALLATLKAGGAYLPLDPSYPRERLDRFLTDAVPRLVLTVSELAGLVPAGFPALLLDRDEWEIEPESTEDFVVPLTDEALAYVIYTSGSTGRPKAAMNSHRGIVNRLLWMQAAYGLGPEDRVLQKTPFSFDVSVWELFWPLLVGARLVMARPGGHREPSYLAATIRAEAITTLHFVPSMLRAFLDGEGVAGCGSVRRVMASGEELTADLVAGVAALLPGAALHNLYGPTEAAVDVSFWACDAGEGARSVPIGRPIANLRLHVVARGGDLLPLGVAGELLIAGVGVGRGYLRRPGLTAARFVPDAFAPDAFTSVAGARCYRTGDLARHRADGAIEFLGRIDHQIKLRGFRIELGEIETALQQLPGIAAAAVLLRESGGDRRLVAYVVPQAGALPNGAGPNGGGPSGAGPTPGELREGLRSRLPEPMVPAGFVFLDAFPLTPSGKLDRRALAEISPETERAVWVPPRTPGEETLAGIWSQVLGVERIGADDHFFALGGHSLLATQVTARVREAFGVELPVRTVFEAPTLAAQAAEIADLKRAVAGEDAPLFRGPLVSRVRPAALPLSFGQERLWFLDQLQPGSAAYNVPAAVELRGELDVPALRASLGALTDRHESLRTTFAVVAGRPAQVIAPQSGDGGAAPALPVIDLGGLAPEARDAEGRRLSHREAARPFDLARGPLLRAHLLRLDGERHALVLIVHHIVTDGWSTGVLVRDLAALYAAAVAGEPAALPALPIQLADFALWQRELLSEAVLGHQLAYWRARLAGAPPLLALPADRPRPPLQRFRGATWTSFIAPDLVRAVERLARRAGATPFMVLLATLQVLFSRLSGQTDILLGTPVAGRARVETEGLIGLFLNSLVLRGDLAGDPPFERLLGQARETTLGAFEHQDVPFEMLVEDLAPQRDLSRAPLFQVLFVLQNTPRVEIAAAGLAIQPLELDTDTVKLDLSVAVSAEGDALAVRFFYATDLFDEATVARWSGHFGQLLSQVVTEPSRPLSRLSLLTAAEVAELAAWNAAAPAVALDLTAPELISRQAAATPGRIAVAHRGRAWTYAQLEQRAQALAGGLAAHGLALEGIVPVLAERSPELLAAMLGAFLAGGAYLPLDPHHPPSRLRQVLEQSRARLIVVSAALRPLAAAAVAELAAPDGTAPSGTAPGGLAPVLLDLDSLLATKPGATLPAPDLERLAYVIFTSGSTGVPKGAMLIHRGMVNHLHAKLLELDLGPGDVLAQTASQCFDISIWQFLALLLVGGRVEVYDDTLVRDPALLLEQVDRDGVTIFETVPSLLRLMLDDLRRRGEARPAFAALRWLIPTGEALPPDLCREWYAIYPAIALLNAYGPTECSDDVAHHRVPREVAGSGGAGMTGAGTTGAGTTGAVAIGTPVVNTSLHVLDRRLQPVPAGVAGELVVGGEGVGRGYLFAPAKTALAFVPDALSGTAGGRLYRTGDQVRQRRDGVIDFLGRIDDQVKVRGFRIEMGEIEAVLRSHAAVEAAVVTKHEGEAGGEARLVAYVVPADAAAEGGDERALRDHLGLRLPEYMVPAVFVFLPALPLSPNGKLDRRALPAPAPAAPATLDQDLAPRTPVETWLAELWAKVLPTAAVGRATSFFTAGGSSLSGAVFINDLQGRLGEIVHVVKLFDAPVLADFARYLENEHPQAMARLLGAGWATAGAAGGSFADDQAVDEAAVARLRAALPRRAPRPTAAVPRPKNSRAAFVLAPPRSGTTLLRVMLGGHPRLFAPPELELLNFETLADRRAAFTGRDAFRLEGAIRAWMEVCGGSAEEARLEIEAAEQEALPAQELYRRMQAAIGERLLVDKTPAYAWDIETLRRAEADFDRPLYLHLVRHPGAVIHSFAAAKLDQIFFAHLDGLSRRALGELSWVIAHQNILRFLAEVPAERVLRVDYERLVRAPRPVMEEVCAFLGVPFDPVVLEPYDARSARMTDGLHAESRMIGDVKFHLHEGIDAMAAERWRETVDLGSLGSPAMALADRLGIDLGPAPARATPDRAAPEPRRGPASPLVGLRPGAPSRPALFLVHSVYGDAQFYRHLAAELADDRPVYGFDALATAATAAPARSIEALAERYLAALRAAQPSGPYFLGGASMGGMVAFEMAQRLLADGEEVALLALFDTWIAEPGSAPPDPVEAELALLAYFAAAPSASEEEALRRLPAAERGQQIAERILAAGRAPAGCGAVELRALADLLADNREALWRYRPRAYPGRIVYLRASERDAPGSAPAGRDPVPAWRQVCHGPLDVHDVPGDHESMLLPPHAAVAARHLDLYLLASPPVHDRRSPSEPLVELVG